jgi:hypothetical protein
MYSYCSISHIFVSPVKRVETIGIALSVGGDGGGGGVVGIVARLNLCSGQYSVDY